MPPISEQGATATRPYRGPASYGAADQAFFHGRDPDADLVVSLILSRKLSLLHAVSGMGKTSLLSALAMPMLEDLSWVTVRSRLWKNPVLEFKTAILDRVLPDPANECAAISTIVDILASYDMTTDTPLAQVLEWFKFLKRDEPSFMALQTFLPAEKDPDPTRVRPDMTPFVTRLFQYRSGLRMLERHVTAFDSLAEIGLLTGETSRNRRTALASMGFGALRDFFADQRVDRIHAGIRRTLEAPGLPLVPFLQRLQGMWGSRYDSFGLVVVVDQFEEIFTQFADVPPGLGMRSSDGPDWELRPTYFRELGTVMEAVERDTSLPPLRLMISMRDDFIANLDQLTKHTGEISSADRFHLDAMRLKAAREAIVEPARHYLVEYEAELLQTILDNLAKEGEWIEPGHLQIVCEYLWDHAGAALAKAGGGTIPTSAMPAESGSTGVQVIISDYFERVLEKGPDGQSRSDAQKVEMLDLLEQLMTQSGTRNIVEENRLRSAAFHDPQMRSGLLKELEQHRIVRTEPRLGGRFVEITHEFLIQPVLEARNRLFRDSDRWSATGLDKRFLWSRLTGGFQRLLEIQHTFRHPASRSLDEEELAALDAFAELLDFNNSPWIAEAMFRSAMALRLSPEHLQRHMQRFEAVSPPQPVVLTHSWLDQRVRDDIRLDGLQLQALVENDRWPNEYSHRQRLFLLDSALANLGPDQRDLITKIAGGTK